MHVTCKKENVHKSLPITINFFLICLVVENFRVILLFFTYIREKLTKIIHKVY